MSSKKYETILNEVQQLFKSSPPPRRAVFNNDKVSFGFIDLTIPDSPARLKEKNRTTVTGQHPAESHRPPDAEDSKQLKLPASSTIQQAAYWPDKQYLLVNFKSGSTYDYQSVPVSVIERWESASSAGSFFYYNIRTSFQYKKVS